MSGKKKNKKRYSKDLERGQRFEQGVSRSANRVSRAVEIGFQTWRYRRSVNKDIGGALGDAWANSVMAGGKTLRELSWAPLDFFYTYEPRLAPQRLLLRAVLPFWR